MESPPKTIISAETIKGIFPLLTVFLSVVEGLFGYWLYRAENVSERIIVGIIMAVIFIVFLMVAKQIDISRSNGRRPSTIDEEFKGDAPKIVNEIISLRDKEIEKLKKSEDELHELKPKYDRLKHAVDDIMMPSLDPVAKSKVLEYLLQSGY